MRRFLFSVTMLFLTLLTLAGAASAHSTKGKMRVALDLEKPAAGDFAYFIDAYVLKELYRNREPVWENRYYVKDYTGIELQGGRATVSFLTLDTKTNKHFPETMRFERDQDGGWHYQAAGGAELPVYTYTTKGTYYWNKYGTLITVCAGMASMAGVGVLVMRRRSSKDGSQDSAVLWAASGVATNDGKKTEDTQNNHPQQQR